jgi:hypothetical protein
MDRYSSCVGRGASSGGGAAVAAKLNFGAVVCIREGAAAAVVNANDTACAIVAASITTFVVDAAATVFLLLDGLLEDDTVLVGAGAAPPRGSRGQMVVAFVGSAAAGAIVGTVFCFDVPCVSLVLLAVGADKKPSVGGGGAGLDEVDIFAQKLMV